MATRYTCLICRHEIAHAGAECPYCKSRSLIAEGASPRILAIVFGVMAGIFILTAFYTGCFRNERRERGRLHFGEAQALMAEGRFEDAISHYRDALLYSRDDPDYRLGLARALFADERYSETANYLVELRMDDPTSGILNLLLARLAARDQRLDEAVSYYRTAIHGRWDEPSEQARLDIRFELVDLLESAGRQQQLTASLLELLEVAPEDAQIRLRVAALLLGAGIYDRAATLYEDLLAGSPRNREALIGRAESAFHRGNYLTARTNFNRAQIYGREEETAVRIALCNRIIELDPARRGIGLGERYRRSRVLLERVQAAVSACRNPAGEAFVGPPAPFGEALAAAIGRADEVLAARRRRASDEAVEANIQLAEEIWSLAAPLCEGQQASDEPMVHVLAKLAR